MILISPVCTECRKWNTTELLRCSSTDQKYSSLGASFLGDEGCETLWWRREAHLCRICRARGDQRGPRRQRFRRLWWRLSGREETLSGQRWSSWWSNLSFSTKVRYWGLLRGMMVVTERILFWRTMKLFAVISPLLENYELYLSVSVISFHLDSVWR